MPDQEAIKGQIKILDTLRKRLRVQIDQQRRLGGFAPAYYQLEIDDAQAQIKQIKSYLRQNRVSVENLPEDGPEEPAEQAQPAQQAEPVPDESASSDTTDVFISYHPADRLWVRGELLPQLDRAGLSYTIDYRDFEIGVPKLINIERAVERSRHTLIIITPDWLSSDWRSFESLLVSSADPAGVEGKLLPLILKPASLPKRIEFLEGADLTEEDGRSSQMRRLILSLSKSRRDRSSSPSPNPPTSQQPTQADTSPTTTDFVIITALEEERDALLAKLPGVRKLPPQHNDIRVYYSAKLPVTFSDNTTSAYDVIVTTLLGMGRVQATDATNAAIYRWKPRYVLLVGIAGGIAEAGVKVGDILISNQIVDYELQKLTESGPVIRWEVHRAAPVFLAAIGDFPYALWKHEVTEARPGPGVPTRHVGPIASGDKVVAFKDALAQYRETWSKLIGVEMEAGGVATAAFHSADQPGLFMIRGVSDLADAKKGSRNVEKWRAYACDVAAAYTVALLRSGPVPSKHS